MKKKKKAVKKTKKIDLSDDVVQTKRMGDIEVQDALVK